MGRSYNPRYCGTVNKLSIKICIFLQISACPQPLLDLMIKPSGSDNRPAVTLRVMRRDPIELEIFKHLYHSIAEEMGAALRRTAFSPNIKERRDYSCAVFDGDGEVVAMGDHMPVHLGSMPMSVRAAIEASNDGTGRHCDAERSLPRRNASSRHHPGGSGLCAEPPTERARISTWRHGRTMPMSAALIPDRWDSAARSIRKAYASHQSS